LKERIFTFLDDQAVVGFTGYINFLDPKSSQLIGTIFYMGGRILGSKYGSFSSHKGLINLLIRLTESEYRVVLEPGIIGKTDRKLNLSVKVLEKEFELVFTEYLKSKDLKPPKDLTLVVSPEYFTAQKPLTIPEFDLLTTIVDYSKVEDVYKNSQLLDFEITNILVSLRKKEAIKVL
jgi:hypothetical protein